MAETGGDIGWMFVLVLAVLIGSMVTVVKTAVESPDNVIALLERLR